MMLVVLYETCMKPWLKRKEYLEELTSPSRRNALVPQYAFSYTKDEDVTREEEKIQQEGHVNTALCADRLTKAYKPKSKSAPKFLAVHQISFGVGNGEVFALLGVNGAGKTTTFKMLTNEIAASRGDAYICGKSVSISRDAIANHVGYCPQNNVLFDYLTVEEHLRLYAAIKGIPSELRAELISDLMERLGLTRYKNFQAMELSGGTKRKLSVGLAVLGNPAVLLLDEPSTGIDPQARRQMWDIITRVSRKWKKSAVVLTTHSMEEAEALSTRLAIMVNGTFRCIGPTQYIKSKFAIGFCVEVKFRQPDDSAVTAFAQAHGIAMRPGQMVNQPGFVELLKSVRMDSLADRISPFNEYADLCHMLNSVAGAPLIVALRQAVIEGYMQQAYEIIARDCGETKVEFVAIGHYKYRITNCRVSVGYLFGMVEEMVRSFRGE